MTTPDKSTLRALIERGLVTEKAVAVVLAQPQSHRRTIERLLVEQDLVSEADMMALISELYSLPSTALEEGDFDHDTVESLPRDVVESLEVLPMRFIEGELLLAMVDPLDVVAEDLVRQRTHHNVRRCIVSRGDLARVVKSHYEQRQLVEEILDRMPGDEGIEFLANTENVDEDEYVEAAPVVKLVNAVLVDAVNMRASDVHVQLCAEGLRIRYRVDGLLRDIGMLPLLLSRSVISRLKVISDIDITETRRPQDGRCHLRVGGRPVDLRVSTLPGLHGEKVVLRILERDRGVLDLDQAGLSPRDLDVVSSLIRNPQGMVIITGPTGSGKTTSLYGILKSINNPADNIITVEDPIEYQLSGVHQVQVHERAGLTFANALRAILRQDPNIIMVGEIRDLETAQIAVQAAMTGHFVLTTLHTNNAPATINRLLQMGVEPYLVASTLLGVVSQRLVRRICERCREPWQPSAADLDLVGRIHPAFQSTGFFHGRGCEECTYTGYRGRMGIYEVLSMTEAVRTIVSHLGSEQDVAHQARLDGMRRLFEDGLDKCQRGITTLEEVLRTAPGDVIESAVGEVADATLRSARTESRKAVTSQHDGPDRILVVDDEPAVRRMLRVALESASYQVQEAADGNDALKIVWTDRPDLIISDVNMPEMDGLELTRRLRRRLSTSLIPLILLTSATDNDGEMAGLGAGADDFIAKPVQIKVLLARVSSLLSRSRGRLAPD